ncbi:PREDICTED: LOW QUALITY PROTEIN: coiled-coil domain-containing protein 63-like, partial [Merops nubicus]|uniref:LOW QUALITY PROTEIN: coiled-coil domain-containing protein 63-like n=1 Tax=Merops nubicus TaxID=57421 RepID=UPI0004F047A4
HGGASLRQELPGSLVKDEEKLVVADIRRLQKRCGIAAEKKSSYGAHVRQQMQAQEREMESLVREHKDVSLTLGQITSLRNTKQDDRNCVELCRLWQTKKEYDSVIRERKALLADLDSQILELEKKIAKQYRRAAKAKHANSSHQLQKRIEALETHLYNLTVRFDTNMTRNKKLQEEITDLQIQKAILDKLYFKLHKKLNQLKTRMNAAMEQITQAYKQWMEALARTSDMKEQNSKDALQYNIEMQQRERVLDQEGRLKTFTLTKFTSRAELEEEARKRKALKAAQRAQCASQRESFQGREVAYRRLLEVTKDRDISQLLNSFVKREEKNFASFNYVTELNNDLEKKEQRAKDLQSEITALMMDQEHAESSSLQALKELEEKLKKITKEANQYEERCQLSSKALAQKIYDLEALCKEINCDTANIKEQLGENKQNMDVNLKQVFGLLEKKVHELLLLECVLRYTSADGSDPDQPFISPLLGGSDPLQELDQAKLYPPPPTLGSSAEPINACEVPLDHNQLRQLVLQSHEEHQGSATKVDKKGRNSRKM